MRNTHTTFWSIVVRYSWRSRLERWQNTKFRRNPFWTDKQIICLMKFYLLDLNVVQRQLKLLSCFSPSQCYSGRFDKGFRTLLLVWFSKVLYLLIRAWFRIFTFHLLNCWAMHFPAPVRRGSKGLEPVVSVEYDATDMRRCQIRNEVSEYSNSHFSKVAWETIELFRLIKKIFKM